MPPQNNAPQPARRDVTRTWDVQRCHRLIRPLTAKLQALKTIVQTQPSAIATNDLPTKETKRDPADLPYVPAAAGAKGPRRRRAAADRGVFGDLVPRRTIGRTYSSSRPVTTQAAPPPTTAIQDLPFPAASIDWDAPLQNQTTEPAPTRQKTAVKQNTESDPRLLLSSLQAFVHESIFPAYLGIYTAFESLLTSTQPANPSSEQPSLQELSVRKIAYCIIATSKEEDGDDDAWYEAVEGTGSGAAHLRVLVRWHGLEMVREAIVSDFMPSQKNGVGMPSVLIGLCKYYGADAEAESLLQTLMDQNPLSASHTDPSLVTLLTFWRDNRGTMLRILTQNLVSEGTPVALGNLSINQLLKAAVEQVETDKASAVFVTRALDSAFGIWGDSYNSTAHQRRKNASRRKGNRKSGNRDDEVYAKPRKLPPLPLKVGSRAEEMCLHLITKLFSSSFKPSNTHASEILRHLAHGFILQDEATRDFAEEAWDEFYPLGAKVLVLTFCLGHGSIDEPAFITEIVRCMEDIRGGTGREGIQRVGEFIASCYEGQYSSAGKPLHGKDPMKTLITRLMGIAIKPPTTPSSALRTQTNILVASTPKSFQTPLPTKSKVVTFTPGKVETDVQHQKERYYLTQLATSITTGFSALECSINNDKWISWANSIEHKIVNLKIRTPAKALKKAPVSTPSMPQERKGWRYEEGLGEWVAVGGTPGIGLFKQNQPKFKKPVSKKHTKIAIEVPPESRPQNWRSQYVNFTTAPNTRSPSPQETPDTSFSQIFDTNSDSDTSDTDVEEVDFYAPTPAKPPSSIRRSPRSAARIRRSLVKMPPIAMGTLTSSPILSRTRRERPILDSSSSCSESEADSDFLAPKPIAPSPAPESDSDISMSEPEPVPSPPRHTLRKRPSPKRPIGQPRHSLRARPNISFAEESSTSASPSPSPSPTASPEPQPHHPTLRPRTRIDFSELDSDPEPPSPPLRRRARTSLPNPVVAPAPPKKVAKRKSYPESPPRKMKKLRSLGASARNVLDGEESEDELSVGLKARVVGRSRKSGELLCRRKSSGGV